MEFLPAAPFGVYRFVADVTGESVAVPLESIFVAPIWLLVPLGSYSLGMGTDGLTQRVFLCLSCLVARLCDTM